MTTLVHHMRDNGIRYGLQTMCEGGGQANATILELFSRSPNKTQQGDIAATQSERCHPAAVGGAVG